MFISATELDGLDGKEPSVYKEPKECLCKVSHIFVCGIFKVLFQLILLVAQYKYDRHFMSHLVIKSKVHYATVI